jgi:hypothetical protein
VFGSTDLGHRDSQVGRVRRRYAPTWSVRGSWSSHLPAHGTFVIWLTFPARLIVAHRESPHDAT